MGRRSFRSAARALATAAAAALLACGGEPTREATRDSSSDGARDAASDAASRRATPASRRPPLWVVGLDGADWAHLDGLIAAGAMPELARLLREGRRGVLLTEHPPLSPLLWTTMVTGVSPLDHQILDFARRRPGDGQPEPITASERRSPAIWNMVSAAQRRVLVLGLWATHPAEPVEGLLVSDRFLGFLHREQAPPGSVFPAAREGWAHERLQAAERAVSGGQLAAFLPWLSETQSASEAELAASARGAYDDPVVALRRILVETAAYDTLFRDGVQELDPDLALLYLQGTDSVGHAFARYAPPAPPDVGAREAERFGGVAGSYFRHVDRLLGSYRRLAAARGARLLLVSDHGFRWGAERPAGLSACAPGTAAKWHREEGIFLLWGPGIEAGGGVRGGVRQLASTLLALLGLPPGEGLAGPPLATLPGDAPRAAVDYRRGYRPPEEAATASARPDPAAAEELAELRALGYLGAAAEPTAGASVAGGDTRTAASFNHQGLILREEGRLTEAEDAFAAALAREPAHPSALWNLSELLAGRPAEVTRSDELLVAALRAGLPQGVEAVAGRALAAHRGGDATRARRLADRAIAALAGEPRVWLLRGRLRLEAEECAGAGDDFARAVALDPRRAEAHASLGVARLCLGDRAGARESLRRSLALDPAQPELRRQLDLIGG